MGCKGERPEKYGMNVNLRCLNTGNDSVVFHDEREGLVYKVILSVGMEQAARYRDFTNRAAELAQHLPPGILTTPYGVCRCLLRVEPILELTETKASRLYRNDGPLLPVTVSRFVAGPNASHILFSQSDATRRKACAGMGQDETTRLIDLASTIDESAPAYDEFLSWMMGNYFSLVNRLGFEGAQTSEINIKVRSPQPGVFECTVTDLCDSIDKLRPIAV